mmetsp:Transcript_9528/g.17704  ORF Transcript_9528/g.17704 Transcript_9528/m.17704 type:complete len:97 (-) Transcript_9528:674-964(-)
MPLLFAAAAPWHRLSRRCFVLLNHAMRLHCRKYLSALQQGQQLKLSHWVVGVKVRAQRTVVRRAPNAGKTIHWDRALVTRSLGYLQGLFKSAVVKL